MPRSSISQPVRHQFLGNLPSYLAHKAKSEVRELFLSSAILEFASAMILFFEPIYLYEQGVSLKLIMLFNLGIYLVYFIIMPLGGKFAKSKGFEHSIFLASPFLILYYLCLVLTAKSFYFLIPAIICLSWQKTFYWPGYHADFAHYGQDFEQGREIGNITVIISLVYILGPFLGGTIIHFFNFTVLFVIVSILIILSNLPLLLTPEKFKPSNFSYKRAYKRLIRKDNRRRFFAYLGFGEELIFLTLWPIFIFIILKNNFKIGGLIALSTLVTVISVLYIGKLTDKRHKHSVLRFSVVIYSLSWFLRLLTRGSIGVFLVDTFSRTGKSILYVPLTTLTYDKAREKGIVKNVVFFEMALVVGKILSILLVLIILFFAPNFLLWPLIFILAGLFTLLYGFL